MALTSGLMLSHFRILEKLGSGGMGEVYRAEDTILHREVALKLLPSDVAEDPERIAQFYSEARILASLNHPNVVTLYSVDESEGAHFLVTEYVEGRTLDSLIPESGMPLKKILDVAIPISEGLSAAHSAGIIHRDLKPSNVMVSAASDTVKLLDFGLAVARRTVPLISISQALTGPLATTGEIAGTIFYMSPEQVQGEAVDVRSDIFSFGVLLYEMITGKKPFTGANLPQVISAILRDDPAPLLGMHPHIPEHLAWIVQSCLHKRPEKRLQSMLELRNELNDLRRVRFEREEIKQSIAVLPFRDMSQEKDQEYFCEGIAEELIYALNQVKGVRVLSRTASFPYRNSNMEIGEMGRRMNVSTVLEGSVRKSGDRLRVTAELVKVRDGYTLWTEKYDREQKDIFRIQDEIAENIVKTLEASLLSEREELMREPFTRDVLAYDFYLRGRKFYYQYDNKGIMNALRMFTRAIEIDSQYARAYCGIADCCCYLFANAGRLDQDMHSADEATRKALELAPDLAEAHASRAVTLSLSGLPEAAESEFETAIRLDPRLFEARYFYGRHCFAQGKLEKAVRMFEQAALVRPDDYQSLLLVGQVYDDLGKTDDAKTARQRGVAIVQEKLALHPDDIRALYFGANALVALGEIASGLEWAGRARDLEPREPMVLYNLACIYALAAKIDEAIDCLHKAVEFGFTYAEWMEHDSNLNALRTDPRFQAVRRSLKA